MKNKNILISGAGIAGLTLAYWLHKFGFRPVVVEKSPVPREGGYMIDFFGVGVEVAEKMGILHNIEMEDPAIKELTFVDTYGKRKGGLNIIKFKKLLNNRAYNILRSGLANVIYDLVKGEVEIRFGTSIKSMMEDGACVSVAFSDAMTQDYDLVIGADGLHSRVRQLAYGNASAFEKWYGYYTSSYTINNFLNGGEIFHTYTIPNKQAALYSQKGNKLTAFFVFRPSREILIDNHKIESQKQMLREEFGNAGWYCSQMLEGLNNTDDFYFDNVSQIKMKTWSKGRVSLVGDACDCPSLLSGQGAALAMTGAYILAGELKNASGDYETAFKNYQDIMLPFVIKKQELAEQFANTFVPKSNVSLWVRNTFVNLMFIPLISKWFANRFLKDDIILKSY